MLNLSIFQGRRRMILLSSVIDFFQSKLDSWCPRCVAAKPYQPVLSDPVLASWRWRAFPELSGLGLRCMIETNDKKLWFGLEEGAPVSTGAPIRNWTRGMMQI